MIKGKGPWVRLAKERSEMGVTLSPAPDGKQPRLSGSSHSCGSRVRSPVPDGPFQSGCCGDLSNSAAAPPHFHKYLSESLALSLGTKTSLPLVLTIHI